MGKKTFASVNVTTENERPLVIRTDKEQKQTAPESLTLVKRIDQMKRAAKNLAFSAQEQKSFHTLSEVLEDETIQNHLYRANIFIFGKVGFFDSVQRILTDFIQQNKKSVVCAHNESELRSLQEKQGESNPVFLLIPTASAVLSKFLRFLPSP